jgi:hypothetical protein
MDWGVGVIVGEGEGVMVGVGVSLGVGVRVGEGVLVCVEVGSTKISPALQAVKGIQRTANRQNRNNMFLMCFTVFLHRMDHEISVYTQCTGSAERRSFHFPFRNLQDCLVKDNLLKV